jgi:hypothetical protein
MTKTIVFMFYVMSLKMEGFQIETSDLCSNNMKCRIVNLTLPSIKGP